MFHISEIQRYSNRKKGEKVKIERKQRSIVLTNGKYEGIKNGHCANFVGPFRLPVIQPSSEITVD
jgi:hypothetical protein